MMKKIARQVYSAREKSHARVLACQDANACALRICLL